MATVINPHVWLTRPDGRGVGLKEKLLQKGIQVVKQPVIDIEFLEPEEEQISAIKESPMLVFTSVYAVESLANFVSELPAEQLMAAVGNTTAKVAQETFKNSEVLIPETSNSEGLLELINRLDEMQLIICKGEGGRNLLLNTLLDEGLDVEEVELYRRSQVSLDKSQLADWQQQGVNCIVATSVEIAESIFQQCESGWLSQCHWIVASDRIARYVRNKGIAKIDVAESAADEDIAASILAMHL